MEFDTRAEIGLLVARARPRISSNVIKTTLHWNGPATRLSVNSPHSDCRAFWRAVQKHHMRNKGWVDIAYTGGVCPHGVKMAGRGAKVRSAANGTNYGNDHFYALMAFLGEGERATRLMLMALREFAADLGVPDLNRHSDHKPTGCPGPEMKTWAGAGAPLPDAEAGDEQMLKRGAEGPGVKRYQQALLRWNPQALPTYKDDSDFGGETEEWVQKFQAAHGLPKSGVIDGVVAGLLASYLSGGGSSPDLSEYVKKADLTIHANNPDAHHD